MATLLTLGQLYDYPNMIALILVKCGKGEINLHQYTTQQNTTQQNTTKCEHRAYFLEHTLCWPESPQAKQGQYLKGHWWPLKPKELTH